MVLIYFHLLQNTIKKKEKSGVVRGVVINRIVYAKPIGAHETESRRLMRMSDSTAFCTSDGVLLALHSCSIRF